MRNRTYGKAIPTGRLRQRTSSAVRGNPAKKNHHHFSFSFFQIWPSAGGGRGIPDTTHGRSRITKDRAGGGYSFICCLPYDWPRIPFETEPPFLPQIKTLPKAVKRSLPVARYVVFKYIPHTLQGYVGVRHIYSRVRFAVWRSYLTYLHKVKYV